MFKKQNHSILTVCKRAQSLRVRRTFSQAYILFIIVSTINVCDRLDLGSWQLFLVGGHPWMQEVGLFLLPGRDKSHLSLPYVLQLSGSCWNWHHSSGRQGVEAATGSGPGPEVSCFWLQVSQRKVWRASKTNPSLSLQDGEDASARAVESKLGRLLSEECAQRTMLLMILSQVQVC